MAVFLYSQRNWIVACQTTEASQAGIVKCHLWKLEFWERHLREGKMSWWKFAVAAVDEIEIFLGWDWTAELQAVGCISFVWPLAFILRDFFLAHDSWLMSDQFHWPHWVIMAADPEKARVSDEEEDPLSVMALKLNEFGSLWITSRIVHYWAIRRSPRPATCLRWMHFLQHFQNRVRGTIQSWSCGHARNSGWMLWSR